MRYFRKKGITAIELLIVLAVLGVIISVIMPQFFQTRENQVLKNAVVDVLSSIGKARGETLSSLNSSEYGVHFQSDKVIIFKGTTFIADALSNESINIITPASISAISLTGGVSDMYFNRLSGSPSKIGTITISTTNFSKVITISATGMASVD